jgi:hypothetical protein
MVTSQRTNPDNAAATGGMQGQDDQSDHALLFFCIVPILSDVSEETCKYLSLCLFSWAVSADVLK